WVRCDFACAIPLVVFLGISSARFLICFFDPVQGGQMGIIAQNKISSLGMLFGAIALMMGIIHFSFGPFSAPPPTFESIVADKTAEIKRGLLAGIKGEKITTVEKKEDVDVDKILDQSGIALAIAALLCAFIGGMRKENRWGIRAAL